jgi:hypothetical protein
LGIAEISCRKSKKKYQQWNAFFHTENIFKMLLKLEL